MNIQTQKQRLIEAISSINNSQILSQLQSIVNDFLVLPINSEDGFKKYGEIDAYSQGKLITRPPPIGISARNMGKNDIWIAATASVTGAKLFTTDKDFLYLQGVFVDLEWIDVKDYY